MVAYTMESVCILFGAKPNWKESKNLMSKMTFMDELKSFDKDNIPPKVIRALKSYIENPGFLPEEVAKVSVCAIYVHSWNMRIKLSRNASYTATSLSVSAKAIHENQPQRTHCTLCHALAGVPRRRHRATKL